MSWGGLKVNFTYDSSQRTYTGDTPLSVIQEAMNNGKVVYYVIPVNEGTLSDGVWTVCGLVDNGNKTYVFIDLTLTQFGNTSGYPSTGGK